jgi:unsaturated chondroitin disaccharide hydrolase
LADAVVRGADWWMSRVLADRVAFWDFDDPAIPRTERDSAATAIAARLYQGPDAMCFRQ